MPFLHRAVVATMTVLTVSGALAPVATAAPAPPPPYIDHVAWAKWGDLSSLRIYPTPAGRAAAGQLGTTTEGDAAWAEVLALSSEADLPGMREQFDCHWSWAEFAQPGKDSWNIEPWRPEVDATEMLEAHCNPGGTEEPF